MNSYDDIIEFINAAKKGFDTNIKGYEITYRKRRDTWNSECLSLYKEFIEILYNSNLKDKENLIQITSNIVFKDNVVNFHNVPGKHENEIIDYFLAHQEKPLTDTNIRNAFEAFRKTVKNEPPITLYKELANEPIEIQTAVREQLAKIRKNEKDSKKENILYTVSKDYLNLFIDENYYNHEVDTFFDNIYKFCEDEKDNQYGVPNYFHGHTMDEERPEYFYNKKLEKIKEKKRSNQYIKTKAPINEIKEDNKQGFIENLYKFLLHPISLCLEELKITDYPIRQKILNNSNNSETLNIRKTIDFFVEKNDSAFWDVTNNFINTNNKFYLGKIKKNDNHKKEFKNEPENERDNLEKTSKAVLDYYHMQKQYKSIISLFNFSEPINKNNVSRELKTNIESIEENLKKKYQGTIYSDIPEIFIKLLKEQNYFYKFSSKDLSEKNVQRTPEQEEYLNMLGENYNNDKKEKLLMSKFKPNNINEALINYESILYNIAARVLDPHIPESQKKDYFKQLTVFYPEVYNFY